MNGGIIIENLIKFIFLLGILSSISGLLLHIILFVICFVLECMKAIFDVTIGVIYRMMFRRNEIDYFKKTLKEQIDVGESGEYVVSRMINIVRGKKVAGFNVYFLKNRKSTEVDVIMVNKYGFFVIESKNYIGKISGRITDKQWIQTKRKKGNRTFYNPVLQNEHHLNVVKDHFCPKYKRELPIYSIIAFSDSAKLEIDRKAFGNTMIGHYSEIPKMIKKLSMQTAKKERLTNDEIDKAGILLDYLDLKGEDRHRMEEYHKEYVLYTQGKREVLPEFSWY